MGIKTRELILAKALGLAGSGGGGGGELPTLTNPATRAEIKKGYQAIDGNGRIIQGEHEEPVYPTAEEVSF